MPPTVFRIVLSVILMPTLLTIWLVGAFLMEAHFRSENWWYYSGANCWITAVVGWTLIWHGAVKWDSRRRVVWAAVVIGSALIGVGASGCATFITRQSNDKAVIGVTASTVGTIAWLVMSTLVIRGGYKRGGVGGAGGEASGVEAAGGGLSVPCPACAYDLRGNRSTTCPECGKAFTLEEIVAAREGEREIERLEKR